jgi:hypothetical protein
LNTPWGLAFSPVPEPATALALFTPAIAGWYRWRRRHSVSPPPSPILP